MDNSIREYNSHYSNKYKNVFSRFSLNKKAENTHTKPDSTTNYNNVVIPSAADDNYKMTTAAILGLLVVGAGTLMMSKGFQKNAGKYLNKLKGYLEYKLELSSLQESKTSKFYSYSIDKLNSFIKKSESINNITSVKDILFMRLMYKTKPTRKIHDGISNMFENLSRKTVLKSYQKTAEHFGRMNKSIDELNDYILKNSPDEIVEYKGKKYTKRALVEEAKGHMAIIQMIIPTFISKEAMQIRYNEISDITSDLYSRFWDVSFKDFWTKNNKFKRKEMWQTFIAAEQIKLDKIKLSGDVAILRNALTYDANRNQMMLTHLKNIEEILPQTDTEGREIIENLKWYIKNPEVYKNSKDNFLTELKKLKNHDITVSSDPAIAKTYSRIKYTQNEILEELAKEEATGEIQDMMSIYYKIAPFEFVKSGAELSIKKAVDSFDKSVNLEMAEFFDKVRDLKLGSAPTDVLTILLSCGMITYGLGYAKDREQRTSVILKSGIPIVGAVATSLISTTKLVSGGKSLALGAVSGVILNQMGTAADKIRQKYFKKPDTQH
ncbi:hypothetical protein IKP85_01415 [bacterium]|nr:hypothetical protein [bacterium]